jgi:hypothetical protein
MYHTTGLSQERIVDLCVEIDGEATREERAWPPILGLFTSLVVTLTYLRRNRVQAELAETYAVSPVNDQPRSLGDYATIGKATQKICANR